jgi:molybdopterin-guanine dinucleotide biosynthesis protein A
VSALVAVLAGGAGRRMGAPKPLAPLAGRPLIAWPLAAAAAARLDAVVVAKADVPLPPLGVEVWLEPDAPRHPLLGIVTALERAGRRAVVAVGCDQPFVPPELLALLAEGDGAAAPTDTPLPARYPPEALETLRAALAAEAPLRRTLASLSPAIVPAEGARLTSVNTPEELAAAEQIASGRS